MLVRWRRIRTRRLFSPSARGCDECVAERAVCSQEEVVMASPVVFFDVLGKDGQASRNFYSVPGGGVIALVADPKGHTVGLWKDR